MTSDVGFTRQGHLGLITLNRPEALNALTLPMINAIQHQLIQWEDEPEVAAVLVQANPGKAFCAGGDVRWLYETGLKHDPVQMEFFKQEYRLNHYIHHYKKPYISLMDGITMGGGVGISLHGSHPVASERFTFAMPETSIGFFPDIGASYLLARCGALGIYLGLTGQRLDAGSALEAGLIKYRIKSEHFQSLIQQLAGLDLRKQAHEQVDACLQSLALKADKALDERLKSLIDTCFSQVNLEDILGCLEKDSAIGQAMAQNLLEKSPLSLKVTLNYIRLAREYSLDDCLKMDYRLVHHFMRDHDFYEGVRALLIDKDKTPKWQPSTLDLVSEQKVVAYFEQTRDELTFLDH